MAAGRAASATESVMSLYQNVKNALIDISHVMDTGLSQNGQNIQLVFGKNYGRIKHAVKQNFRQTRKLQAARSPQRASTSSLTGLDDPSSSSSSKDSEFREAELLMHYLDYIFPIQYAYYVDKPATGGRGWLFWLLSKQGPLRQAAFTLSALHQHSTSETKTEEMESELIRYHTNAMQELRQVLIHGETDGFASHPEQRVEFLTCGTFLISFEVLTSMNPF